MSAFVVSNKTINHIVTNVTEKHVGLIPVNLKSPTEFGRELIRMNIDAVLQRYEHDKWDDYKDQINNYVYEYETCSDIQAYKSAQCLRYQCSEGDVPESPMFRILEEIISDMGNEIICNMPEYDSAKWDD